MANILDKMLGTDISWLSVFPGVPQKLYNEELPTMYTKDHWREMQEIIAYYKVIEEGASFVTNNSDDDFLGSELRYKLVKQLLYKEARFMASKPLEFVFDVQPVSDSTEAIQQALDTASQYKQILDKILRKNRFDSAFVKAVKDCLIGKRIALVANFNVNTGIQVTFVPSLEFIAEYDDNNTTLTKFIAFYTIVESTNNATRRIYKKKYEMDNGYCHITEQIYNGSGDVVETIANNQRTELTFIPAVIILNDGLTGDDKGESEVEALYEFESWYSKMSNGDMDAERRTMNPITYTTNADAGSTKGLSRRAGAFWDLATAPDSDFNMTVGQLESSMGYSGALTTTLDRIKSTMFSQVGVPDVSLENIVGTITSGKGMKAVYWDLIIRIEEKMLSWKPAIEDFVGYLMEGARLYPESLRVYTDLEIPDEDFTVTVENRYPIMEDETEERSIDLSEVASQCMSRKSYMRKWRNMTDADIDAELQQLALERQLLEASYFPEPSTNEPDQGNTGNPEEVVDETVEETTEETTEEGGEQ